MKFSSWIKQKQNDNFIPPVATAAGGGKEGNMTAFWIGLVIGIILEAIGMLFVIGLCVAAKQESVWTREE